MWNESIASRGSCGVGSCIISHLKEMQTTATSLVVYSDACSGQNRNIHIVSMCMHIVAEYSFKTIDHKFMVSGHSYLPNDRDFGSIEIAWKKTAHIYVPEDWGYRRWYGLLFWCPLFRQRCIQQMIHSCGQSDKSSADEERLEQLKHWFTLVINADYQMQKLVLYWGISPQPGCWYYLQKLSYLFEIVVAV